METTQYDEPSRLETLADLRIEIDRIDAALHRLLMERGEIIHRLIEAKARQGGGSAFRPGREADMMRALVSRHHGLLPLDTVEGIWRIIISTFTYIQSNYSVHADISGGDATMRDSCRFHFGFTVPYVPHPKRGGSSKLSPNQAATSAWSGWIIRQKALVARSRRARGAQDHRQAALRRAAGPSGRNARLSSSPSRSPKRRCAMWCFTT